MGVGVAAVRTLEERAAEAAKPAIDYDPGRLRKMCWSCHERVPTIYAADDEITNHANTCPSVVIPELLARLADAEKVIEATDVHLTGYGLQGGHTYDPQAIAAFKRLRGIE